MPIMISPGVKTRELDFSMYASAVSTTIVGMVGGASKGPIGIPTYVTNPTEFVNIFGEPTSEGDYGAISAMLYLLKGNALWYVREENGTAVQPQVTFDGIGSDVAQVETATVTGSATADADVVVTVTGANITGSPKAINVPVLTGDTADDVAGKIRTALGLDADITSAYTVGGTGADITLTAIDTNLGTDATLNVAIDGTTNTTGVADAPTSADTTVGEDDPTVADILTIKYKDKGTYGEKYSVAITNASGLDFTFTSYEGGVVRESFSASLDDTSAKYIANKSSVDFEFEVNLQTAVSIVNASKTALAGGSNGLPLTDAQIIGVGNRGLNALANPNVIDITVLAVPGRSEATIINKMLQLCEDRADCFAIIDPPIGLTPTDVLSFHNGTLGGLTDPTFPLDNSFGAMYYPWVKVTNPSTAQTEWVPPSAVALGAFAINDEVANPWFAPAGLTRGRLDLVLGVERDLTELEMDSLYGNDNAINPIINFRRQGYVIWGQRTLQREDSALDRINVRRLMLYVRKLVSASSAYVVFEQNDVGTWTRWTNMVTPYLESIKNGRGVYEYRVQMDSSTVTADHIDRNEMPGKILIRPTKTAEFVVIDFVLKSTGADFN